MLTTNWTCRNAYHTELHTLIGTSLSEPHTVISSTMSGFCLAYIQVNNHVPVVMHCAAMQFMISLEEWHIPSAQL